MKYHLSLKTKQNINKLTECIRGPRAKELSAHLPVMTTSAPQSRALAMGPAL